MVISRYSLLITLWVWDVLHPDGRPAVYPSSSGNLGYIHKGAGTSTYLPKITKKSSINHEEFAV